jgi:hypothetical protein
MAELKKKWEPKMSNRPSLWEEIKQLWNNSHDAVKYIVKALGGAIFSSLLLMLLGLPLIIGASGSQGLSDAIREEATTFIIAGTIGAVLGILSFGQFAFSRSTASWAWIGFLIIGMIYWYGTGKWSQELVTNLLFTETPIVCPTDICPPPQATYTPYPTYTPQPTHTPYPDPEVDEDRNDPWLSDNFASGKLDLNYWEPFVCQQGRVAIGHVEFVLSGDARTCLLKPRLEKFSVEQIRVTIIINKGVHGRSWAGILTSCGSSYIHYLITPSMTRYYGAGIDVTNIEYYNELPISRTLIMEWTGSNVEFSIEGTDRGDTIECSALPDTLLIAVGINDEGSVDVEIDDVQIWGQLRSP